MGLFDKFVKVLGAVENIEKSIENVMEQQKQLKQETTESVKTIEKVDDANIVLLPTSHLVEEEEYGDEDTKYCITFQLNDAFKEAKSHAAEVSMLNTYAPNETYGKEGTLPYVAIQIDDDVYCPVEEFKEKGTFDGAIEITPLNGKFYFKAKKEYYGDMMYFYGMDRCDGLWENNGLCMVYPKSYVGTENEVRLMQILDEAAESYKEVKVTDELS